MPCTPGAGVPSTGTWGGGSWLIYQILVNTKSPVSNVLQIVVVRTYRALLNLDIVQGEVQRCVWITTNLTALHHWMI